MNKKEKGSLIRNYLFDNNSKSQWIERFGIAWDIWEIFEEIKKEIRKKVVENIYTKLKNHENLKNYEVEDKSLINGEKFGSIIIYKKSWGIDYLLKYTIEAQKKDYYDIYYGISKQSESIPFKGNWEDVELSDKYKRIFEKIKNNLPEKNWSSSEYWIFWRYFDEPYKGMWKREFYEEIINKSENSLNDGCNKIATYYVEEIVSVINNTEKLINSFIKLYKDKQNL